MKNKMENRTENKVDNKTENKIEKNNLKYLHIAIIVIGILFIFLSIFHVNMWFDESYSVAITRHSFSEIWQITGNDVHPPFYYFCLHVFYCIFGNNIIVYRLFSALTIAIVGILGYSHIRKDFGEKTGILFSFFTLFLPVAAMYAGEIRMYSLAWLLGTVTAIYAYRIYKGKITKITYWAFGLSSLLLAYTHYYGLMLAGIINLVLFIYLCKNRKERNKDLKKFIITAIIQVCAYSPWLLYFMKQVKGVSGGFWIHLSFPQTFYEILTLQYNGSLNISFIVLTTCFYAYILWLASKTPKAERKTAIWSIGIYVSIILIPLIFSLIMLSAILLARYLLVGTGLLIFGISFIMAKDTKRWRILTICAIILVVSCISNSKIIKENYQPKNREWISYMEQNMQNGDIIVYTNAINGAVVTTDLSNKIPVQSYFYDEEHWNVEEAYKAYSPYMKITSSLEEILNNYTGRIWIVEGGGAHTLAEKIEQNYNATELEQKEFEVPYRNYSYTISLYNITNAIRLARAN